jgi:hypothetical protein
MEYWKDGTVEWWSNAFYEASDKRRGEGENGRMGEWEKGNEIQKRNVPEFTHFKEVGTRHVVSLLL